MTNLSSMINQAATLLYRGDSGAGIAPSLLLANVLRRTISARTIMETEEGTGRKGDPAGSSSKCPAMIFHFRGASSQDFELKNQEGADNTMSGYLMFQDPIFIFNSNQLLPSLHTYDLLSYVALYNLALYWHWSAVVNNGDDDASRQARLKKALMLYNSAHSMIVAAGLEVDPIHYMAILNNTGHIHHCLGDGAKAEVCFQELLLGLKRKWLVGNADVDGEAIKAPMEVFKYNLILRVLLNKSISAPAA
jgi:hypothetical protein